MVAGYFEAAPVLLDSPPLSAAVLAFICSCLLLTLTLPPSTAAIALGT